jgi:phage terminase small subunit
MAKQRTKLTPKQQRFVEEYLLDLNASQAALRAGYSADTAGASGHECLKKPKVAEAIRVALEDRKNRSQVNADDVISELKTLALSDIGDILDFSGETLRVRPACDIPGRARRSISSVKVKRYTEGHGDAAREVEMIEFKLWDKLSALEKLGKHIGMFKEKIELTGADAGPIKIRNLEIIRPKQE